MLSPRPTTELYPLTLISFSEDSLWPSSDQHCVFEDQVIKISHLKFNSAISQLLTLYPLSGMATPGERNLNGRKKGTVLDLWSACDQNLITKLGPHQIRLLGLCFHSITWVSHGTQHSPTIYLNIILWIILTLGNINVLHSQKIILTQVCVKLVQNWIWIEKNLTAFQKDNITSFKRKRKNTSK